MRRSYFLGNTNFLFERGRIFLLQRSSLLWGIIILLGRLYSSSRGRDIWRGGCIFPCLVVIFLEETELQWYQSWYSCQPVSACFNVPGGWGLHYIQETERCW
jgi:hypothetical protein